MNKAKLTFTNQTKSIVCFCFWLFFSPYIVLPLPVIWCVVFIRSYCHLSFATFVWLIYYISNIKFGFLSKALVFDLILRRCWSDLSTAYLSFSNYNVVNIGKCRTINCTHSNPKKERNDQKKKTTVNSAYNLPKNEVHTTGAQLEMKKKIAEIVSFIINSISIIRSIMRTAFFLL